MNGVVRMWVREDARAPNHTDRDRTARVRRRARGRTSVRRRRERLSRDRHATATAMRRHDDATMLRRRFATRRGCAGGTTDVPRPLHQPHGFMLRDRLDVPWRLDRVNCLRVLRRGDGDADDLRQRGVDGRLRVLARAARAEPQDGESAVGVGCGDADTDASAPSSRAAGGSDDAAAVAVLGSAVPLSEDVAVISSSERRCRSMHFISALASS